MALVLAFCLFAAGGCAKNVGATFDPLAIFPAQSEWVWDEAASRMPNDERLEQLNVSSIIRDTAAVAFAARGYTQAPAGSDAPYRLSYELGLGRVIEATSARGFGSLSMTLSESKSKRRVWVGFIRVDVDTSMTESERRERLQGEMHKMLEEFPPSQPD
jgi:hypothetical protein